MSHRTRTLRLLAATSLVTVLLAAMTALLLVDRLVAFVLHGSVPPWQVGVGLVAVLGGLVGWWVMVARALEAPLREMAATVDRLGVQNQGQAAHRGRGGRPVRSVSQRVRTVLLLAATSLITVLLAVTVGLGPPEQYGLGLLAVLTPLVGWWVLVARVLEAPLRDMTATVDQLSMQNLGQRIGRLPGDDALARLAAAVDAMADRVAAGFEGQRRFAANASHELRTPLAVQRTIVELAVLTSPDDPELRRLADQILLIGERNERIVEGMLVLAESDRGLAEVVALRLDELVAEVLDTHAELAAGRGVRIVRELAPSTVPGDRVLLERLVTNLVRNGLQYNGPEYADGDPDRAGSTLRVRVGPGEPALQVSNTGPEVPAESVTVLFEPFRRLHRDRTHRSGGAGLGLSIVRSIAMAHGGRVAARPNAGGGLVVDVILPAL